MNTHGDKPIRSPLRFTRWHSMRRGTKYSRLSLLCLLCLLTHSTDHTKHTEKSQQNICKMNYFTGKQASPQEAWGSSSVHFANIPLLFHSEFHTKSVSGLRASCRRSFLYGFSSCQLLITKATGSWGALFTATANGLMHSVIQLP